jgi:uncharacterized metal-binding protein (TIGR02443 family)
VSEKPPRRRFIAGARCPRCGLVDKIVIEPDTDRRRCVSCGFSEDRPGQGGPPASEPPTRVTRAAARRVETPVEPVTLLDTPPSDKEPGK